MPSAALILICRPPPAQTAEDAVSDPPELNGDLFSMPPLFVSRITRSSPALVMLISQLPRPTLNLERVPLIDGVSSAPSVSMGRLLIVL
jgi:hypothetical protein